MIFSEQSIAFCETGNISKHPLANNYKDYSDTFVEKSEYLIALQDNKSFI